MRFALLLVPALWACEVTPSVEDGGYAGHRQPEDGGRARRDASQSPREDGGVGGDDGGGGGCGLASPALQLDPDRTTLWNPGILRDDQLHRPLGADGLPVRTEVCASLQPGDDIQAAVDACPEGQVVELAPGTFEISATVVLTRGVVLRGAGSQGAPDGGTTIVRRGGETVLAIGGAYDSTCYGGEGAPLTADGEKESTVVSVGAAASRFSPGQLALIDELDDPTVDQGDCPYFKRVGGRSVAQRVEIVAVDVASGTLTLGSPLHWRYRAGEPRRAEITPVTAPTTRWAGIEHLRIRGGSNPGYNGQRAGGIELSNAAYSWVKDVQTDESNGGMHVALTGTYRCVVRDGYFHHSADYGFGRDCYGIVLRCGTAESLVENNVVRYMNKPIMLNATGGGNVIAYNYADNSWATPPEWQEVNIDTHCAFPHMELIEGNYAPHIGATTTHGNNGYMTFFRNYASSQFARPTVAGADVTQTGNVTAIELPGGDIGMNVLGNVLGTEGVSRDYDAYGPNTASIYELGHSGGRGANDVAVTSLYRTGNFDYVTREWRWADDDTVRALPPSLYLGCAPAWWPSDVRWPWVGPDVEGMVATLPAHQRATRMAE